MAIVNLVLFDPQDIPGMKPQKLFPRTDYGNYGDMVGRPKLHDGQLVEAYIRCRVVECC